MSEREVKRIREWMYGEATDVASTRALPLRGFDTIVRTWSTTNKVVDVANVRLYQHSLVAIMSIDTCSTSYEAYLHHNLYEFD